MTDALLTIRPATSDDVPLIAQLIRELAEYERLADAAVATEAGLPMVAPPLALCGDNGAMIAWAGLERLRLGLVDDMSAVARPRWPLDELSVAPSTAA